MRSCKTLKNDHRRFPVPHPAYTSQQTWRRVKTMFGKVQQKHKKSDLATTLLYVQTIFMFIHFHSINFWIDDLPFSMHIFHIYFPCVFHAFWDDLPGYSKGNSDGSHGSPGTIGLVKLHRLLIREAGAHC